MIPKLAQLVLTQFLDNEITKAGFSKAVLGLSGGIDSALSCYLAAKLWAPRMCWLFACLTGLHRLKAWTMPQLVIEDLGIASETVEITGMVDALAAATPDMTPHRLGNVMARARMTVIYDRSFSWNGLVIGTSNKTELLLGYGTIFGDLASAVNPIGDLYKTQIRQLSRAIGVPAPIIDKAPSADLIPGQTDEDDLGFTYAEVDNLLYRMVDERFSRAELMAEGYAARRWLIGSIGSSDERSTNGNCPSSPKLAGARLGHDFRYLRDWGT